MSKGNIGVTSDNIFPVIKKFLYSDHEIFLRELVSNAVDATQKLKTLASVGEVKGELGDTKVRITIDKAKQTLTVSDHGIGMTAEEIDKYINQIAISGAEEFVGKYKDNAAAIIGHFGLGFYSAFMVAKQVEIYSLSYQEDAKAVHWTCSGDPNFELEETIKSERGTDIVLHIDDEHVEYLEDAKIEGLLKKYCKFLPVEIVFGKKKDWKDGRQVETEEENVINETNPAWLRKPQDLKEEDYKEFYHTLYPDQFEEPLFHIHLNVDYPFHLTGILYFPKIKNNMDIRRHKIQLYCNQVFVTDEVENIVPEYLTLLHGVIDSPDIPLNVSRSYLQSDQNVKKISSYITRKVADQLDEIFRQNREDYEQKWDDVKLFIQYGMLTDEKFYEKATRFALLKDLDGKYFTFEEYKEAIKDKQTDKNGDLICLYTQDRDAHYSYIQRATEKGYSVLMMNGELDVHALSQLEQKNEKTRFVRVDSDTIENLIQRDDTTEENLTDAEKDALRFAFEGQLKEAKISSSPNDGEVKNSTSWQPHFTVQVLPAAEDAMPVFLTQNEWMRRMKEMSAHQQGMAFYGQMPDEYNLVINSRHPLILSLLSEINDLTKADAATLDEQIAAAEAYSEEVKEAQKDKKYNELTEEEKNAASEATKAVAALREEKKKFFADKTAELKKVSQLIDLAKLASGLLKGEPLAAFVKRSVELL